ncbi:MAG: hypothetical protein HY906_26525 [Deltaproteobacteria bacterium]|nr:hypothetical protein [Deltaproteobacteria bacterium]
MACATLLPAGTAHAEAGFVKVIPPGTEPLVVQMLGGEPVAGCHFRGATIDRTVVQARYECAAGAATVLELRHVSADAGAVARTAKFAIVPHGPAAPALVEGVTARIREREGPWRWLSAEAPGLGTPPAVPTAPTMPSPAFSTEEADAFLAGVRLFNARRYAEARAAFLELARKTPHNGVLGMVVASVASGSPDGVAVGRATAAAEAAPGDTLLQFVAGVTAHYHGHQSAPTRAAKAELYRTALKYLERTRPAYDFEPRVYVYLAVSHFRLGHQAEAEKLIEQAIPLATNDPDVYYCRAEILQRVDPARAVADIETYLSMVARLHSQGVPVIESKHARVRAMLAELKAAQRGAARSLDLFDPLPQSQSNGAALLPVFRSPRSFALLVVGMAVGFGGAWLVLSRRRRRA